MMADSSQKSESVRLKHISTSFFSFPGIFSGFGGKGASENDAGKSPTSPLDFGVFANFGGLFSPRSPACSSPRNIHQNKRNCGKVGLSILNQLVDDTGLDNEGHSDSFRHENVVLSPRIKIDVHKITKLSFDALDPSAKANSLPKDYESSDSKAVIGGERVLEECYSSKKSSSSPMNVISSRLYSRSLSGREMTLSEDYTCIISHGPNPKTTHIFGEHILDCDPKELVDDTEEELGSSEDDPILNQDGQRINTDRFGSQTEDISAEEAYDDALVISPGSSYHEDVFPMGNPLNG